MDDIKERRVLATRLAANMVAKFALGISDNQALTQVNESLETLPVVVFPRVNSAG